MKRVPIIATAAVVAAFIPAAAGSAAVAASHPSPAAKAYHGTRGSARRLAHATTMTRFRAVREGLTARQLRHVAAVHSPSGTDSAAGVVRAPARGVSATDRLRPAGHHVSVIHNFNGLSNSDVLKVFGPLEPVTPPDQGLCVGHDATLPGDPEAVFEPINIEIRETTADGTLLRPDVGGPTFYQDPFTEGDVRCLYDPATQTFFFTEIGFPVATGPAADFNNSTVDVVVMNAHGVAAYQFDTSLGGPAKGDCFGDQPKTGFDNNALIVSTDEFCDPNEDDFEGSLVLAISKPQLVREAATVNDAALGPLSLAGAPVLGLDPAIDTGSGRDYLVDSVSFLADGFTPNPVGDTLGVWTLRNTRSVTTGAGAPVMTGTVAPSQDYAFPVPATSTGDGSSFSDPPFTITSEPALQPDDSRISGPVSVTHGRHGIRLWTALDAAVTPPGASAPQDAAAWFEIDPAGPRVVRQGYVTAAAGDSLLYPALAVGRPGPAAMTFTITSSTIDPAAAFSTLGSQTITTVAAGSAPHQSFTDSPPFSNARWGDYSFAVPDLENGGVWLATEYIPPPAFQAEVDNWGTEVFEVTGR
ncbi:MAG TPA: hypothetical protein VH637_04835 [Streptosporangiaceae bacterium]|jgi:hypothetical protein